MKYATPQLRVAAARLFARDASEALDATRDLAAEAAGLLDTLWKHLAQVIGRVGTESLWLRTVRLVMVEFPFLEQCLRDWDGAQSPESLRVCLSEQEPDVAREAAIVLFATIAGLLATLVGETLTRRLVRSAWPEVLEEGLQEAPE